MMVDPVIAPETQRLAEENHVDWRTLRGSGAGGEVLERDVLTYLARVMLGTEATDPTPEPLPEGLSAWPEEPARPSRGGDLFSASLGSSSNSNSSVSESQLETQLETQPEPSPWRLDAPELPSEPGGEGTGIEELAFELGEPDVALAIPESTEGWAFGEPEIETAEQVFTGAVSDAPRHTPQHTPQYAQAAPVQGVSEAVYQEALTELETLRARLATLEEERLRHVGELHQLSRMQETIALQKNEGGKLSAAQSEVQRLRAELAAARGEAQQMAALEAKNRDLEERLTRARTFRKNAKAEYERLLADNMMLEHETADLKKRRGLKLWGK